MPDSGLAVPGREGPRLVWVLLTQDKGTSPGLTLHPCLGSNSCLEGRIPVLGIRFGGEPGANHSG